MLKNTIIENINFTEAKLKTSLNTSGFGDLSSDHNKRTPSNRSIILNKILLFHI